MAWIVDFPHDPRCRPGINFAAEDDAFTRRYLANVRPCVQQGRYDPDDAPKRASLESGRKALPDFVAIHGRLALSPETRALVEEFEPGVRQFLPVAIVRPRSKKPIHRLDGRVLEEPYHPSIPQTFLDAV